MGQVNKQIPKTPKQIAQTVKWIAQTEKRIALNAKQEGHNVYGFGLAFSNQTFNA